MRRVIASAFCSVFLALPSMVAGEQSSDFGEYVVHYVALPTTQLTRDVARAYNIQRSKSRAMLNVTILRKKGDEPPEPVTAQVNAIATNLTGQRKNIAMRTVGDGDAIYYIGEFTVAHREVLDFDIEIVAEENGEPIFIEFRQQFYVL